MNEIQPPKSQPPQPTQLPNPIQSVPTHQPPSQPSQPPKTPPQSPPPPPKPTRSKLTLLWTALIMFIIGIIGGILLFATFPKSTPGPQSVTPPQKAITLPKDAAKIQNCMNNKGELYVSPKDKPQGPFYMVYKNKVIGLEYKIEVEELFKNKKIDGLNSLNGQVNHINIKYLPSNEQETVKTHALIDLYIVDSASEKAIICESPEVTKVTAEASISATLSITPEPSLSITPSLSPAPTTETSSPAADTN